MYVYCQPSKTMTAFVSQVVNEGSRSYFYTFSVDRGQRISPHRYAFVTKKIAKTGSASIIRIEVTPFGERFHVLGQYRPRQL